MSADSRFTLIRAPFTIEGLAAMFKSIADREPTPEQMAQVTSLAREPGAVARGDVAVLDDDADAGDAMAVRREPRRAHRTSRRWSWCRPPLKPLSMSSAGSPIAPPGPCADRPPDWITPAMPDKPKLALLDQPFTAESLAEFFTALTGRPVDEADMAEMRETLRGLEAALAEQPGDGDGDLDDQSS